MWQTIHLPHKLSARFALRHTHQHSAHAFQFFVVILAENVEILYDKAVEETSCRQETERYEKFPYRREIRHVTTRRQADEYGRETVDDKPEARQETIRDKTASRLTPARVHDNDRNEDTDEHLRKEYVRFPRAAERHVDKAAFIEIVPFQQEVDDHRARTDDRETVYRIDAYLMTVETARQRRLDTDNGRADEERRHEIEYRNIFTPVERIHLRFRNEEECPQRRLMKHGEDDPEDKEHRHDLLDRVVESLTESLRHDLAHLKHLHRRIE